MLVKSTSARANGRDGATPQSMTPIYDKYECFNTGYGAWYCPTVGQVTFNDDPYWFSDNGAGAIS